MQMTVIGDLARSLETRAQAARLAAEVAARGAELASGTRADPARALRGDFGVLADTERGLALITRFETGLAEAEARGRTVQASLARLFDLAGDAGGGLLTAGADGAPADAPLAAGAAAREAFLAAVSALNARSGGRAVFAGADLAGPALRPGAEILADLRSVVAGLGDAAQIGAAVQAYFAAPGGGFETAALLGSDRPASATRVAPDTDVTFPLTAADPALREMLAALALGALAADTGGTDPLLGRALARQAGEGLAAAQGRVALLQADVGAVEARLAGARAANAAESAALQRLRNDLRTADPQQTALALEAARFRLEALFTVTGRLADLSLVNFLR